MAKTLLAVDDSVTMRKVFEITFGGDDFTVVTAEGQQDALGKAGDAAVCVIDTALGNDDGYALAKEIRKRNAGAAIILLASRHNPYDATKGKDAGADDFMDKPFDTQQMIDKVRKVIVAKEGGAPAEAKPAAAAASPAVKVPAAAAGANVGAVPPIQQRGTQPSLGQAGAGSQSRQRAATLMFGGEGGPTAADVMKPAAEPTPAPAAAAAKPVEKRTPTPVPPATVAATPAAMHGINGHLAGQLEGLGLTKAQADAVLALSREVVEKVVWEVVPVVAEALIKEEIARLTKEG